MASDSNELDPSLVNLQIEMGLQAAAKLVAIDSAYRSAVIILAREDGHDARAYGDPSDYYAALAGLKDEANKLLRGEWVLVEDDGDAD